MTTGITSFLAKGTGAKELRSALWLRTRRLGALLQAIDKVKTVGSEVPRNVLGTDLLGLLSNRMRELLQNDEETPAAVGSGYRREPKVFGAGDFLRLSEPIFAEVPERGKLASRPDPLKSGPYGRDSVLPLINSHNVLAGAASLVPHQMQPDSHANWHPMQATGDISGNSFPQTKSIVTDHRRTNETVRSLLATKLQEYWDLSRQQPVDKDSYPITTGRLANEATSVPQSAWRPTAQVPRSWPGITGQQVARRIHSLAPSTSSSHAVQAVKSNSPDRIEIENVFNIEVKAPGGSDTGSADLSEKIADILREQALQHGIDIT